MNIVNDEYGNVNVAGSRHEILSDEVTTTEESEHETEHRSEASSVVYRVTQFRWVVLSAIFALNLINAAFWLTYSVVADEVANKYGVSKNVVNLLSQCLSALYGPVVWTAAPLVQRFGFAHSVRLAALFTALGGCVRYAGQSHETFFFLIIGQCLSGIARPVISQLLGLVSLQWFPGHERVMATAVCALGNPFGIGMAFLLSPMIVKKGDPDAVVTLNLVTGIIGVAMAVFVLLVVRERPEFDPSEAAVAAREGKGQVSFCQEMKYLLNGQYWMMAVAFGFAFGQINAISIMLSNLLLPFGYSHAVIGLAGVMTIIPGVVGAGVVAGHLGKKPMHREALIAIYTVGAVLLLGMFTLACRDGLNSGANILWLLATAGVFGFFAQPCFSVAIELGCEVVYPASPAIASAGVVMCAQYGGLIMSLVFGAYINAADDESKEQKDRVHLTGYIMTGCWIVSALLMCIFRKDNMARLRFEEENKRRRKLAKIEAKRAARIKIAESHIVDEEEEDDEHRALIEG